METRAETLSWGETSTSNLTLFFVYSPDAEDVFVRHGEDFSAGKTISDVLLVRLLPPHFIFFFLYESYELLSKLDVLVFQF